MQRGALDVLCCPTCRGDLVVAAGEDTGPRLTNGTLKCSACRHTYPVLDGVPCLLPEDRSPSSDFDSQWQMRFEGRLEGKDHLYGMSPDTFVESVVNRHLGPIEPGDLVIDAGCGTAERAAGIARRNPAARVLAFDLSSAVIRGARAFGDLPNLYLAQADVRSPPARARAARKVISWGVIHHTDDPRRSFERLAATVARGGRLVVWLYPHPSEGQTWWPYYFMRDVVFANRAHRFRPRTRLWAARAICAAAILPIWGRYHSRGSVTAFYPGLKGLNLRQMYDGAVMATYDILTPEFQHRPARAEVVSWFRSQGFGPVYADDVGEYHATMAK